MDPKLDRSVTDEDPSFNSATWVNEFSTLMEDLNTKLLKAYGFSVAFGIQTTIKSIDETVIDKLKKAGLAGAYIGVESVDSRILKHMAATDKTGATDGTGNKFSRAIKILNERGINVSCATMVEPGCEDKALETVSKLIQESPPHEIFIEYRAVYPGTPDEKRVIAKAEGNSIKAVPSSYVIDCYNKGVFNGLSIPNPEDRTKVIVKTNLDGKLIVADPEEVKGLFQKFYTELGKIANLFGYRKIVDGHYIKLFANS